VIRLAAALAVVLAACGDIADGSDQPPPVTPATIIGTPCEWAPGSTLVTGPATAAEVCP